jgi:adenylate cyclase
VLEDSVRRSGARIRITAQLIDATTGGHIWADRFDRELTDIFDVQDDVTAQIVSALSVNLTSGERQRIATARTDNLEAYDCYLKGRELWRKSERLANEQGRQLLERAIGLDPDFAPAHALLAVIHTNEMINGWSDSPETARQNSIACAARAIALDDDNPEGHWAMAVVMMWSRKLDEALREAERAIALDPNHSYAHGSFGLTLHYAGRSEEALQWFDRATALDPLFIDLILHFRAQSLYALGRYAEAAELSKLRIAVNPKTDASRVLLAACLGEMGRFEEAREAWRGALAVSPGYSLDQRRKVLPYKNPEDFESVVEGLRKAGLP